MVSFLMYTLTLFLFNKDKARFGPGLNKPFLKMSALVVNAVVFALKL